MRVGLPILANTAAFGAVLNVDRVLILWRVPDGARAAGLYSIAILGTSWSLDLAGRIVLVLYTSLQTTLGRTGDIVAVARQAAATTEAQATPLAAGSAVAYSGRPALPRLALAPLRRGLARARAALAGDGPPRPRLARPAVADHDQPALPALPGHDSRAGAHRTGRMGRRRPRGDRRRGVGDVARLCHRLSPHERDRVSAGTRLAGLVRPSGPARGDPRLVRRRLLDRGSRLDRQSIITGERSPRGAWSWSSGCSPPSSPGAGGITGEACSVEARHGCSILDLSCS